ncbi:FecR domain-containing protein [Rariglobus hedericola]|nr:FecR domain-containing protein [Rariglobus hedericola]
MSTIKRLTCKTGPVFLTVAFFVVLASFSQAADSKRKNPTSKLYVADVEGISSINTGEKIEDLTKKSVYAAEGTILETTPEASNAIVLSNGTGIAFDPDTRLEMRRFLQEPFSPNRTDLEVEPSVSQTTAFIGRGTVGMCTSKMVAGSTMTYNTRHASVAIRGRKVVIETSDDSTVVSLLEGDVTVRGDLMSGGQSLKPGQQAVITRTSNSQPPSIKIQDIPPADMGRLSAKVTQACMARKTVYFEVSERKNIDIPEDILIPVPVYPGVIPPSTTVSPYTVPPAPSA